MAFGLKAEYDGYHIHFEIETFTGDRIDGYFDASPLYFQKDSLQNTVYLIRLFQSNKIKGDSANFGFYQDKISYTPTDLLTLRQNAPIKGFLNDTTIAFSTIKNAKVLDMEWFSYCSGTSLFGSYNYQDTLWMQSELKKSILIEGYLTAYEVHIFEDSPEKDVLLKDLELLQNEIDDWTFETDQSGYSEEGFLIDEKLSKLIRTFKLSKTVILLHYDC